MKQSTQRKLFQEVFGIQDKIQILGKVAEQRVSIKAKVGKGIEFVTTGLRWYSPIRMEVVSPPNLKLGLQKLTLQFDYKQERYFTFVDLAFDDWKLFFVFTYPLYRLQRRQYQRLLTPYKYPNRVLLMKVNEDVWNQECEILDMSLDGCSLKLPYSSLEIPPQAIVMLDIQLGAHAPFIHIGQVRYKRLEKFEGKSMVRIGVQFQHHPKFDQSLNSAVQAMAIDLFTNWSQRKNA